MARDRAGTCRLCLTPNIPLCDSHIVPAWAWDWVLPPGPGVVRALSVGGGKSYPCTEQVTEYLLCRGCENVMNVFDNYIAPLAARSDGLPVLTHSLVNEFELPASIDPVQLAKFALSVVWRAHVSSVVPSCDIAPYGELLRRYFHERADLTPDICCDLMAFERGQHPAVIRGILMPESVAADDSHLHRFYVSGLCFTVVIGPEGTLPGFNLLAGERNVAVLPRDDIESVWLETLRSNPPGASYAERLRKKAR